MSALDGLPATNGAQGLGLSGNEHARQDVDEHLALPSIGFSVTLRVQMSANTACSPGIVTVATSPYKAVHCDAFFNNNNNNKSRTSRQK